MRSAERALTAQAPAGRGKPGFFMSVNIHRSAVTAEGAVALSQFLPLDRETRHGVDTDCAAFHLNRRPQTLRVWACKENGPLRPIRINGRLMWPTAELRRLCGVAL